MIRSSFISFVFILAGVCLLADFEDPKMSANYTREVLPLPAGEVMEPGSIALLPDDRVLVGTRRGELWICEGAYGDDLSKVTWTKYFDGMHEPLGMFWKDGALYYTDREQYGRLIDHNGDNQPDVVETISAPWGINGNYHESKNFFFER